MLQISATTGCYRRRLLGWVVLAVVVGAVSSSGLAPQPAIAASQSGAVDSGAEQVAGDLALVDGRIARLQQQLERLGLERQSVIRAFESADIELALRRQQFGILERRGEMLDAAREPQAAELARLQASMEQRREQLRQRVVSLYRIGPLSYNRLLLAAETARDLLAGYQLFTYLASRDRDLVESVRTTLDDLRQAQATVEGTSRQLVAVRVETAAAVKMLAAQQEQRQAALERMDQEAETQRLALAEAERTGLALENTIAGMAAASKAVEAPAFARARGVLPWPAVGDLVGAFGRRRHPIYGTYTVSRGIEIGAAENDPVRAVFDGKVVFADWYSGYGLLVIVDHGGGFFTLYGHLGSVTVGVNGRVGAGEQLGLVGETGSLTGPNLYFELREGTEALNPMPWLVRR